MKPWPPPRDPRLPALEYVPATHKVHVAADDEVADCALFLSLVRSRSFARARAHSLSLSLALWNVCLQNLWRAGKRGQRSRHTLHAPALEYVPARHNVHVAADDEVAPACPCVPAAHAEPEHELAPDK